VVIEKIMRAGTYVKEGMVQAAIGRFPSTDFTVIDREAIVSFSSQPEKDGLQERTGRQMAGRPAPGGSARVVEDQAGEARRRMRCTCRVQQRPRSSPSKSSRTRPPTRTSAWSVLQAALYADLFQLWANHAGAKAHEVLHDMAGQRKRIGLPGRYRN